MIFIDTHVVVWLYVNDPKLFSQTARDAIERNVLYIAPIVLLELEYLFEIERINIPGAEITNYLSDRIDLKIFENHTLAAIKHAVNLKWTRDPFDRIITAYAIQQNCQLLTKDKNIRANFKNAIW